MTVGIDPTGGTDWRSGDIIWRNAITRHDQWVYLELEAYTSSGEISVWTRGSQVWPVKHNDSYWDDAQLEVLARSPAADSDGDADQNTRAYTRAHAGRLPAAAVLPLVVPAVAGYLRRIDAFRLGRRPGQGERGC